VSSDRFAAVCQTLLRDRDLGGQLNSLGKANTREFTYQAKSFICVLSSKVSGARRITLCGASTSRHGWCGSAFLARRSGLPILTEFVPTLEHVRLGVFEIAKDPSTFYQIAGAASRNEILSMLHPLLRPRVYKIHGHNQGILKVRCTIEPAILATVLVPFQDAVTLFRCQWLGQSGQAE
jgi:hypothetical protein